MKKDFTKDELMEKLLDRRKIIGAKADDFLKKIEKKEKIEFKNPGTLLDYTLICVWCGKESNSSTFKKNHKCAKPSIVRKDKWLYPTMPRKYYVYRVKFNNDVYLFCNYQSAMLFRHLLWLMKIPIKYVLKNKNIQWLKKF